MDPYEMFDKDFKEFVRQGVLECFGDHPGSGVDEIMAKVEDMHHGKG